MATNTAANTPPIRLYQGAFNHWFGLPRRSPVTKKRMKRRAIKPVTNGATAERKTPTCLPSSELRLISMQTHIPANILSNRYRIPSRFIFPT